jgi:4'-phosphopantetheinyl transferase
MLSLRQHQLRRPPVVLDAIDLYLVPLAECHDEADVLDTDEQARAARFAFDRDRRRYVLAHVALRQVLAAYSGRSAKELCWIIGPNGKPKLADDLSVQFSLSHSGDWALIAVSVAPTMAAGIGVDLETPKQRQHIGDLASNICTPAERNVLGNIPASERELALLALWTRKEAVLKACGRGLTVPPNEIDVGITGQPRRVQVPGVLDTCWTVWNLDLVAGVAAVAVPRTEA